MSQHTLSHTYSLNTSAQPFLTLNPQIFLGDSPGLALYTLFAQAYLRNDYAFEEKMYATYLEAFPGERHEHSPTIFKKLITSIRDNGFDFSHPVTAYPQEYFTSNGLHRMAASIALGLEAIPYVQAVTNDRTPYSVFEQIFSPIQLRWFKAHYTELLHSLSKEMLLLCQMRQHIISSPSSFKEAPFSSAMRISGAIRPYQGLSSIGLQGKRDALFRFTAYNLEKYLTKDSIVLETGCNCGFLSWLIAQQAHTVDAFDIDENYIQLGTMLKEAYGTKNLAYSVSSFEEFKPERMYDIIVSCAVYGWTSLSFSDFVTRLNQWIKPGGVLLFESHELPAHPEWAQQKAHLLKFYDLLEANYIDDVDHSQYNSEFREFMVLKKQ